MGFKTIELHKAYHNQYNKKYNQLPRRKKYMRNRRLMEWYGITVEQFESMVEAQSNRCAICGEEFNNNNWACVDHNHDTKKIRDILCNRCNKMLGDAKESTLILQAGIEYLNKHSRRY